MTQTDWQEYREIILIRHPETKDNRHRDLSHYGKEQARRVARGLAVQNRVPDVILTSPAARAIQAAKILAVEFYFAGRRVTVQQSDALEGLQTREAGILAEVSALPNEKRSVALVGSKAYLGDALFLLGSVPESSFEEYGKTIVLQSNAPTWKDFAAHDDAKIVDEFRPEMVKDIPLCAVTFLKIPSKPPHPNTL